MNNDKLNLVEHRARMLFQDSSRRLDPATNARLRQARMNAVNAQPRSLARRMLVPCSALAASALALVVAWNVPVGTQPVSTSQTQATSLALQDNTDMNIYHDLDFYRWLASQPEQPQARN